MTELKLYNTLTRKEETFQPIDPSHVRMYACGPTVYDRAHIGNARSAVVYDVLVRLLRHIYPEAMITYARNITDVDDKINAAAKANGEPISTLTGRVTQWFHDDMGALNVLTSGTAQNAGIEMIEPRATWFVNETGHPSNLAAEKKDHMVAMIQRLIDKKIAYSIDEGSGKGHVLFDVSKYKEYGQLSGRTIEEQQAGARIAVESYKQNPGDFVLWKPALSDDDPSSIFDSPWGRGRPGWHIECSVMSTNYLGDTFDIHGGGADLMFPHHENEIAQSRCANGGQFARYWVHNGFLTVNGEKMSKSLGNFITVRDLLDKGVKGEVIRFALLSTHYRKPLDWTDKLLEDAQKQLDFLYRALEKRSSNHNILLENSGVKLPIINNDHYSSVLKAVTYDLAEPDVFAQFEKDINVSYLLKHMLRLASYINTSTNELDTAIAIQHLIEASNIYGILQSSPDEWFKGEKNDEISAKVQQYVAARAIAKQTKDFSKVDRLKKELKADGIILEDRPDGTTDWRRA